MYALRPDLSERGLRAAPACPSPRGGRSGDAAAPQPSGVRQEDRDDPRALARLILDRVLEVETETGFVSGAAALDVVFTSLPEPRGDSVLGALSLEALRWAQERDAHDAATLADRLYRFHRKPRSPGWLRAFPDERAVAERLGLDGELGHEAAGPNVCLGDPDGAHWLHWRPQERLASPGPILFKLYVSPDLPYLRDALSETLRLFDEAEPPLALKVGRTLSGLLRPDKLVAHFGTFGALERAADSLATRLSGLAPHGVPFTVERAGDGLLSWGVDPPAYARPPGWERCDASWRLWLTNRLAAALFAARQDPAARVPPWRFALARIALDGVDPATWTPDLDAWAHPRPGFAGARSVIA